MRESHTQYPEKSIVWAGITGDKIVGPLFIEGILNGAAYSNLSENSIKPELAQLFLTPKNNNIPIENICLQQDGTPYALEEAQMIALLSQYWIDPRLGANVNTRRMAVTGQIWKPEITNINGMQVTTNCDKTVFWRGYGDEGSILYSEKVDLRSACTEYLHRFPFDTQICEFRFGSYRFPEDEVLLSWRNPGVILNIEPNMRDFELTNVTTFIEIDIRDSGNFSVVAIQFTIRRHSKHYIFCFGIPCFVLTLFSYSTLWFGSHRLSLRLTTSTICFGVLLLFYYISVCLTYPVPYLKALDIFAILNLGFSFITILEPVVKNLANLVCNTDEISEIIEEKIVKKNKHKSGLCRMWLMAKIAIPLIYVFCIVIFILSFEPFC